MRRPEADTRDVALAAISRAARRQWTTSAVFDEGGDDIINGLWSLRDGRVLALIRSDGVQKVIVVEDSA